MLIPNSFGVELNEFNSCHEPAGSPKGGQFCSKGGQVPPEPGTTPIPPGMVRGYHYTDDLASVLRTGLSVAHAKGSTYGEPNAIWMSTVKPGNFKDYVEVFVTPDEIGLNGPFYRREPQVQEKIDEYNRGNHDFTLSVDHIPAERFVTHHEPWHDRYRYIAADPVLREEVLRGEFDWMVSDPRYEREYGTAVRRIKQEAKRR